MKVKELIEILQECNPDLNIRGGYKKYIQDRISETLNLSIKEIIKKDTFIFIELNIDWLKDNT